MSGPAVALDARPRPLAVIAGAGPLPVQAAEAAHRAGRPVFVACLSGSADPDRFGALPRDLFGLGQFGALLKALRARETQDVIILGAVTRPGLGDIRPDFGVVRHLGRLKAAFASGDDGLLRGLIGIFESEGLRVLGVLDVAPGLAAPAGRLTRQGAGAIGLEEIAQGRRVLDALSPFDIGQGVVVSDGRTVAIEGAEGTDGMLARVREMRASGRLRRESGGGVLVKWPKTGQDLRVDLPTIGPRTVTGAVAAGLAGIAIAAGQVLIAERDQTIAAADAAGLFLEAFA